MSKLRSAFIVVSIGWLALIPLATFLVGRSSPKTAAGYGIRPRHVCDWQLGVSSATGALISPVWSFRCRSVLAVWASTRARPRRLHCSWFVQRSPKSSVPRAAKRAISWPGFGVARNALLVSAIPIATTLVVRVDHRRHSGELDTRGERSSTRRRCRLDRVHGGIRTRQSGYCKLTSRARDRRTNTIELARAVVRRLLGDPGRRPLVARATVERTDAADRPAADVRHRSGDSRPAVLAVSARPLGTAGRAHGVRRSGDRYSVLRGDCLRLRRG